MLQFNKPGLIMAIALTLLGGPIANAEMGSTNDGSTDYLDSVSKQEKQMLNLTVGELKAAMRVSIKDLIKALKNNPEIREKIANLHGIVMALEEKSEGALSKSLINNPSLNNAAKSGILTPQTTSVDNILPTISKALA